MSISTPNDSPEGEKPLNDELPVVFNPATQERPVMDEEEWLYLNTFMNIEPQFNPVTQFLDNFDE